MKPDYKNWIPKGMLVSLIAGTVLSLALLLVFGVFGIGVSGKLRVALGVVFGIAFVVCAKYTQWCVYAYRRFSYDGERKLSKQIIDGTAKHITLPEGGVGLDIGCGSGALTIHTWVATMAWFTTYLGPRIGVEAALAAVTAYQDDMLPAILPMYVPMLLVFGIHFVMLLAGKTRYPRWMLAFHLVTWNLLLVAVPDIAQAMQVPTATWMSVMSQGSTNTAIVIWCIAAAVYERSHTQ